MTLRHKYVNNGDVCLYSARIREGVRVLKNPCWTPRASVATSANTTRLVWVGSKLAQGGHLRRRSLRACVTVSEQPLDVLSRGDEQGFGVHLLRSPQPEPPQPMPVLGLAEERFNPHLAPPQCLAVGFGIAVATHPVEILLIKAAPDPTSLLLALRAAALEGARVAGGGLGGVPDRSLLVVEPLAV